MSPMLTRPTRVEGVGMGSKWYVTQRVPAESPVWSNRVAKLALAASESDHDSAFFMKLIVTVSVTWRKQRQ